MKVGKEIGVIKEIVDYAISFENFCELDTVSYMRRQLKQTKFKNPEAKTKHSGGGISDCICCNNYCNSCV
jgi:hypothetical protein